MSPDDIHLRGAAQRERRSLDSKILLAQHHADDGGGIVASNASQEGKARSVVLRPHVSLSCVVA